VDRARIAEDFIARLDAPIDRENDLAWQQKIAKRLHEIDAGAVTCISWEEAKERLCRNSGGEQ